MYKIVNCNLLYYGCIPMTREGDFDSIMVWDNILSGCKYLDSIEEKVRKAFDIEVTSLEYKEAIDYLWYLWCGPKSSLFGKNKLVTFERYFISDEVTCDEDFNPYYYHIEETEFCENILKEFGLDTLKSHIINGHVPVRTSRGESTVKGGRLLFLIDGGISKAYYGRTGIGGYTLISNSHHMVLAEHRPYREFVSAKN